jgi:thioredoxin-like negative regulator of GroEL
MSEMAMLRQVTSHHDVCLFSQAKIVAMRLLTQADIACFLAEKRTAAIHFDANWNAKYRAVTRSAMAEAEQVLAEQVNLGEVDCDSDPELPKSIAILNVPSVAYYRDGKLVGTLIGANQNVRLQLERVLRGEIGRKMFFWIRFFDFHSQLQLTLY